MRSRRSRGTNRRVHMRNRLNTLALLIAVATATVGSAATIIVFNPGDSGSGTLRQALFDAAPGDTIEFKLNTNFVSITSGELVIDKDVTINGPGGDKLTLQTSNRSRAFYVTSSATASISGLNIRWGDPISGAGGAIFNAGNLNVARCAMSENRAVERGGAVANQGTMRIVDSTISQNFVTSSFGYGAAVHNTGTLSITNSTISDNTQSRSGFGGGIANLGGSLILTASTVCHNVAAGTGSAGGGIYTGQAITTVKSSIIALNTAPAGPDAWDQITSDGFNIVGIDRGARFSPAQPSDRIGTVANPIDPLLGPLQYNGGWALTRALRSDSPAVNHGAPDAPSRDQRGYLRDTEPDSGAFEFGGTVPVSLANISTRADVGTGDSVLIGGFIVTGSMPKKVMVRAIGPSLPLPGTLANPLIELRDSANNLLAINDDWRRDQPAEIIATGIPPAHELEAAIVLTVPANQTAYTALVRGVNNTTGVGLVELYDLNRAVDSKLANISTRGRVRDGDDVLIGGLIVSGEDRLRVLIRAVGPSLGVTGQLADPRLELRGANGELIRSNDNWRTDQEAEIIATTIPPRHDAESALLQALQPASYTAIVRGANGTSGVALVEVYSLH